MVHLIAYTPEDGWGYAREGTRLRLLKPPYQGNHIVVGVADVERAVTVHGYLVSDLRFKTERALIEHLRQEVVRSWPLTEAPEELREDLLLLADPDEIDFYIEEATAWLSDGRRSEVEILSNRLFRAKALTDSQRRRLASLLETVRSQRYAKRKALMASKFSRVNAKTASVAPAQDVGSTDPGVLRPTG